MALPVAGVIDAVKTAWDVFMMFYQPTYAGEPFEATPFIYTAGTYNYYDSASVTWADQPAYLEYNNGWFSVSGHGHGGFTITANTGNFSIGYWTPGVQSYTTFEMNGDGKFVVERNAADYPTASVAEISKVYVNKRPQTHSWSGNIGDPFIAFMVDGWGVTNISNNSGATNAAPSVVPLTPGTTYTYDDALNIYIDFWRDKYPDWDLTADDFPNQEDYLPTEPTEPGETLPPGSGFVFDYGEVISPSELESILDQETYEIDTVQSLELVNLEMPELDTLPQDMVVAAGSLMTAVTPIFTETGLLVIFLPLAIVMILIIFLRRGR